MTDRYDAVVVGSGPNGLAAGITLAQAGWSVLMLESRQTVGGGMRSAELTLPGFTHDICSATHPLGMASPFFRTLPLEQHGLEWIHPPIPVAHPLDRGSAVAYQQSIDGTAAQMGQDAASYQRLMGPLTRDWAKLLPELLGPLRIPRHPLALARFGLLALRSARGLAQSRFQTTEARAAFAGMACHAIMPLEQPITAAFGLVLSMLAHAVGWPFPRGGTQRLADALSAHFRALGGVIRTANTVRRLDDIPPSRAILFDTAPRQLVDIVGDQLPSGYRRKLEGYRYGPGVCKLDIALEGPIPWAAEACRQAGSVHVGGTFDEIAAAERDVWQGVHPERPFVLLAQHSLFDPTRAPDGKHTVWAYCHVPNGSSKDMTARIEAQIERFAPGFRQRILARHVYTAVEMEGYNPNYIGGDINSGVQDWRQLFTRPVARLSPYTTPVKGIYLCSSATPPGGGVHGMCGYYAARAVLKDAGRLKRNGPDRTGL
jgi:phytoene dehydrogenase-like protein